MRFSEDARKCVIFIGVNDDTPGSSGIRCVGTAFFVAYEKCAYLVTAKHVALAIADAPFKIRINRTDGTSDNFLGDEGDLTWHYHSDPTVDLAAVTFQYDLKSEGCDVKYLSGLESLSSSSEYECGDLCYTIGLFQVLAGTRRNLPVVHSGNIALLPSDERIPVRNWEGAGAKFVEGYLVQSESIQGLSGAPVFARSHVEFDMRPIVGADTLLPKKNIGLLGVWQGAWDARPDEVRAASLGSEIRVPVGMGVVIPIVKLKELLDEPVVKEAREKLKKKWTKDAQTDSGEPALRSKEPNPVGTIEEHE